MIILTDKAKDRLSFFMQDKSSKDWGVRIRSQGPENFGFSLEMLKGVSPLDKIVPVDGYQIVFANTLEEVLNDSTIDYVETEWNRGFKVESAKKSESKILTGELDLSNPTVKKIQGILTDEINPSLSDHGGFVRLLGYKAGVVSLQFGGGCHGCAMSQATLRNGIELRLKEEFPEITEIVDVTDHATGANPYFSAAG